MTLLRFLRDPGVGGGVSFIALGMAILAAGLGIRDESKWLLAPLVLAGGIPVAIGVLGLVALAIRSEPIVEAEGVWESQVPGLTPYSMSLQHDEDGRIEVRANATLSGRVIARTDLTLDTVYVRFRQRSHGRFGRRLEVAQATVSTPNKLAAGLTAGRGHRMAAGDIMVIGPRALFSAWDVRPPYPVSHGRFWVDLVVKCSHPRIVRTFDFPDKTR